MRHAYARWIWFCVLCFAVPARAQVTPFHDQVGFAYGVDHFSPETYGAHSQNFGILQDARGVMYGANLAGVLEYDSQSWRTIAMPNGEGAISLALSDSGVVFVGGNSDLGYLAPDSLGLMRFVSMRELIPEAERDFATVWSTHATSKGIYFQTSSRILRWDGQRFTSWHSDVRLHTSFTVFDRLFVRTEGVGLMEVGLEGPRLVPGGGQFSDKRVVAMVEGDMGRIMVAAQEGVKAPLELYHLVEGDVERVEIDQHFDRGNIAFYHGARLPWGYLALSTLDSGVHILRMDGTLVQILDEDYNVAGDGNYVYADANGSMWIAHNANGITRVTAPVVLTQFERRHGLEGTVHDMLRHEGSIYAAAAGGVVQLRSRDFDVEPEDRRAPFARVPAPPFTPWSLARFGGTLLAGTEGGILQLRNGAFETVLDDASVRNVRRLLVSSRYPDRLYVGMESGVGVLTRRGSTWRLERVASAIDTPVLSVREAHDGTLWVVAYGNSGRSLWKVSFAGPEDRRGIAQRIDPAAMPWEGSVVLAVVDGAVRFIPKRGLFMHEVSPDGTDRFVADTLLGGDAAATDSLVTLADMGGSVWIVYRDRLVSARKNEDGSYAHETIEEVSIPEWETSATFYKDEDGIVWIASGSVLYRYVQALDQGVDANVYFKPLVRSVTIAATSERLIDASTQLDAPSAPALELDHATNDLTFDYVLPDYSDAGDVRYSVMLENADEAWSAWGSGSRVTYRNLKPGAYQFRVRAQTHAGVFSDEANLSVHIGWPWYWNPWAWLLYAVVLATPVVQYVRIRHARTQLKELERERIVNARLNTANSQLRSANETLKDANKMKDEFLASASHELRTPLTAILGFTSVLKEEIPSGQLEFLELIDENGKRLLKTINSLLDLTKLRAGMLDIKLERLDVCSKSEEIVEMMSQLAKNKQLKLQVSRPEAGTYASLDVHCFERIMYNLLGNAIKFTNEGGIDVAIEPAGETVRIVVRDSGIGIAESFLPQLFQEFKQEPRDDGQPEGSGLGLAITAHLVELMNGSIHVDSVKGQGSTFTVVFPVDGRELRENGSELEHPAPISDRASHPLS